MRFFICFLFLAWQILPAQTYFQNLYQPAPTSLALANCVQPISGGDYLIAGTDSANAAQDRDMYLVKVTATGDTLWARSYGTTGVEYGQYAIQSNDGGYMLAGVTINTTADIYVVRANANGDTVWTRTIPGSGDDEANFVQQTNDGNFIIAGYTNTSGAGSYDYLLIKIDANGNVLWSKTYGTSSDELAYSVFQAGDKGYIIAGAAMTATNGIDIYAVKTDSTGAEQWSKYYGTTDTDWGYMMRPANGGGYILTGYAANTFGGLDALLIKTNASGDTLWTRAYGGTINFEQGLCVVQASDGGYAISGSVYDGSLGGSDAMLLRTDNNGNMLYCHGFGGGGDDWSAGVLQAADHSFILGGYSNSFNGGAYNFYLVKTDTLGNGNASCNESVSTAQQEQLAITTTTLTSTVTSFTANPTSTVTFFQNGMMQNDACNPLSVHAHITDVSFLRVYPNPSAGYFSVQLSGLSTSQATLVVQDIFGREIHSEKLVNTGSNIKTTINLSSIAPGTYSLRLTEGQKTTSVKLVVIR